MIVFTKKMKQSDFKVHVFIASLIMDGTVNHLVLKYLKYQY